MPLDMKAEIGKLQEEYNADPTQSTFNVLLTAESGTGKTFIARTCRFPVHIDSFDRGGTKGLRKWIESGDIIVDREFEHEDPFKPKAYRAWKQKFDKRLASGYFDYFGTYMLDSSTTWSDAIMNYVMSRDGVAGQAPRFTKDYTPQKIEIRNSMLKILGLPCDCIVTGHLKLVEDPESGAHKFRFLTTGSGMVTIPMLFDEIYVLQSKKIGSDIRYELLTKSNQIHLCRSRMAGDGLLKAVEEPDIKKILAKCGLPADDKPKLT